MDNSTMMTTREVADALGISVEAVRLRGQQIGKVYQRGKVAQYTVEEVTAIKELIKEHPSTNLPATSKLQLGSVTTGLEDDFQLAQAFAVVRQAQERLDALLQLRLAKSEERCRQLEERLDLTKEWASVKRMEALNEDDFGWHALKQYSIENGYEIKKVFDQNYGEVNAYHKDVWQAVYGERLLNTPWERIDG